MKDPQEWMVSIKPLLQKLNVLHTVIIAKVLFRRVDIYDLGVLYKPQLDLQGTSLYMIQKG